MSRQGAQEKGKIQIIQKTELGHFVTNAPKQKEFTMNEHTGTPWIIEGQDIYGHEKDGRRNFICQWSGRSADARLIAKAPETKAERDGLIEAFEYLLKWISQDQAGITKQQIINSVTSQCQEALKGE